MTHRDVCKKLEDNGWVHKRTTGSHYIYSKPGCRPVPVKCHSRELPDNYIRKLEKETGLSLLP